VAWTAVPMVEVSAGRASCVSSKGIFCRDARGAITG